MGLYTDNVAEVKKLPAALGQIALGYPGNSGILGYSRVEPLVKEHSAIGKYSPVFGPIANHLLARLQGQSLYWRRRDAATFRKRSSTSGPGQDEGP